MYLIIGLGNPGPDYEKTRHNLGRNTVLAWGLGLGCDFKKFKTVAQVSEFKIGSAKILLCLPETFMNDSGLAVKAVAKFYKIPAAKMVVVYDDLALPFGQLRLAVNHSSGGHNGVQSVIDHLGSRDFIRLRLGIGPQLGSAEKFVLHKFSAGQLKNLPAVLARGQEALEALIELGLDKAAARFN